MTEFEEYLRGTFEINNGIENDVDNLVRIHAPELLKLARKELMKDAIEVPVTATGIRANSKGVTTYADIEIPTKERLNPRCDKVKVIII